MLVRCREGDKSTGFHANFLWRFLYGRLVLNGPVCVDHVVTCGNLP